ncbi:ABC transporter substrate-binding protein [Paenibacillus sp. GCM10023248]|uniref:ABC transporter substrate-binding protein n=1 Tax=Bacillales TaxID=1385 RepID=UPI002378A7EF|nr:MULTISPECIES: extracellular solute-binding protein [Bacillales]MDD9269159.1 extracellular solute-binding protein [Paenibacillus sp. MAHUQ-63]MDR6880621.1 multiple sugar transport system substrate-binding protein [Bacillus sp. 3255]
MKMLKASFALALTLTLAAGCTDEAAPSPSGTGAPNSPQAQSSPENELFIYTVWPAYYVKEEIFQKQIGDYIKKKFPNITIKHVHWDNPGRQYKDLIAAGTIPDIIMDDTRMNVQRYLIDNDLQYDISELIKKYNFDTSKLNPAFMAQMKNLTPEGKIYGLPFFNNDFALFYNKDIFDKFGVDYPKDGMTYDEIYEMAKKLTRVEGDITYKGFSQNPGHYLNFNQLSLSPLSKTEDKGDMSDPGWKKLVDNMRRFYEIPANQFDTVETFASKPSIAMAVATVSDHLVKFYEENKNLNFDIASVPSLSDAPNTKYQPNLYSMYITKQSKKKDLAFQVMDALLSEEHQIELAKEGVIGPLQTDAVKAAFGKNLPQVQGKNVASIFASQNAMPPGARNQGLVWYDVPVQGVFQPLIFKESKDSVTALRMVQEAATKSIETVKAAKSTIDQAATSNK